MKPLPVLASGMVALLTVLAAGHESEEVPPETFTPLGNFYHVPQLGGTGELYLVQFFAGPFQQAVGLTFDSAGRNSLGDQRMDDFAVYVG